jgi:hypothetical protein
MTTKEKRFRQNCRDFIKSLIEKLNEFDSREKMGEYLNGLNKEKQSIIIYAFEADLIADDIAAEIKAERN